MDLSSPERRALDDLRNVARRYCTEIEFVSQRKAIEFLEQMNQLLPELYWRASLPPDVDPWADKSDELDIAPMLEAAEHSKVNEGQEEALRIGRSLRQMLGILDTYQSAADPSTESKGEGWISNDLTDIYFDLHRELINDKAADESEAERCWHWRFAFTRHWGVFHLPPTLHAISWLVHQYWDEDDEKWDDTLLSQRPQDHHEQGI